MNDLRIVQGVLDVLYPFIALYAWYSVHRHNKMVSRKLDGNETKMNGVLHELIAAREEIAYKRGFRAGKAEGVSQTLMEARKQV